jgi:predicted nucleic acid-binding Zn ribbon protein
MVKAMYPATCNKCGKHIDKIILKSEDSNYICESCERKNIK